MADLKTIIIGIIIFVSLFSLILLSSNIHMQQISSENIIEEATKTFLDTVTDKGALTWNDYDNLVTSLTSTGGTFDVSVTIQRLFAISNTSPLSPGYDSSATVESGFVQDYRPIHGLSTQDGSWQRLQLSHDPATGEGTIFMRRHDLLTLYISQTSLMPYQLNMLNHLNQSTRLRDWTYARGVRNSGNAMVENEDPPINFD